MLAARGQLSMGREYVHESILDTNFVGRIVDTASVGQYQAIVPSISGRAWITGVHQLGVDPTDPCQTGFTLSDVWGRSNV